MIVDLFFQALHAALGLLKQPFYYFAGLLIVLHYIRQTRMERKLFHVRLHAWPKLLFRALLAGIVVGAVVSIASAFIGMSLTPEATLWVWGTTIVLLLIRVRYLCFAYSVGILGLLKWIIGFTSLSAQLGTVGEIARSLAQLDIPGLLLLVALMHAAEALLVRWEGTRFATPIFLEGKRGKLIGGYTLQGYWPVPLLLIVPATGGLSAATPLPWTPLLGGSMWDGGWTMIALPAIIGFTDLTRSMLPQRKAQYTSRNLLLYSIVLGGTAIAAAYVPVLLPLAALCSLLIHELLIWVGAHMEQESSPLYVHNGQGLTILGVVPGTPAEQMGLQAGEILHKVNGKRVYTKEDFHEAFYVNSAFCKLEVFNTDGQLKFLQRARYAGEHFQLGVILAPDEDAGYYAEPAPSSLIDLLRRSRAASRRETERRSL